MKKIILPLMLLLATCFSLVSCDDFRNDLRPERMLVGRWESIWTEGWHEDAGGYNEWSESIAGEIQCTYNDYGHGIDNINGTFDWKMTGDVLNVYYIRYPNDPVYLRILDLTETSLVVEDAYSDSHASHSERITFRRIY